MQNTQRVSQFGAVQPQPTQASGGLPAVGSQKLQLGELQAHAFYHSGVARHIVTGISWGECLLIPTDDFWRTLLDCFRIPHTTLQLMDEYDLFQLLCDVAPKRPLTIQIQADDDQETLRLTEVSDPHFVCTRPSASAAEWATIGMNSDLLTAN